MYAEGLEKHLVRRSGRVRPVIRKRERERERERDRQRERERERCTYVRACWPVKEIVIVIVYVFERGT